jgi:trehalose-phosphatase
VSSVAVRADRTQSFFATTSECQNRALLLDYDGTIAPLVTDRTQAYPYPSVPELLESIMIEGETRVVVISGRPARDLPALLRMRVQPEIWGSHGLERIATNGKYKCFPPDQPTTALLQAADMRLQEAGLGACTEKKLGAIAVHWRGLSDKRTEEVKAAAYRSLGRFIGQLGLRLNEFDGGLELCCRACSKRNVVETIMSELATRAAVAYLGDDVSDEESFRFLNGRGLSVLVRPSYRFTAAQYWLRPPDELQRFLHDWVLACQGEL